MRAIRIAEIFSLGCDGGRGSYGGHGGSERHYRHGDYDRSNYGHHNGDHYDRHNDDGPLGTLGAN